MSETTQQFQRQWLIGERHAVYGVVAMQGRTGGEQYRWFTADEGRSVAMVPLFMLQDDEPVSEGEDE